ncbi:MAG: DNA polymerase I [Caldilineaceae bacterium]|nr:DNA polymerase I [Caldilineaceae bacterium]
MAKLLLVDGHSQAYRAYFGVKAPLMTRSGELTTAVYGFTRKLLSLLREHQPDYVAVAFDKGDTWRHADFPDYKATRDQMPDDMRKQMLWIEEVLEAFNIPIVTATNYEADDVLGTLACKAAAADVDVLILTGDRDMFQLVSDRVKILYTRGGPNPSTDLYGLAEVSERYENLTPAQFIDMKAIVGDSSDNIPGVAGVGEKTAIKFLQEYGSLDNLYAHLEEIRGPKTRENLREAEADVRRNRKLVEIVTDLDVEFDAERFRLQGYNTEAIREIFERLEFRTLLREVNLSDVPEVTEDGQLALFAEETPPPTIEAHPYRCVQTAEELAAVVDALRRASILSFDVETTAKDPMRAALVGLGVAWAKGEAAYIPVGHTQGAQLDWEEVKRRLQPFFADANLPKLGHNIKYDVMVCRRHGLDVAGPLHDTMTMAFLLDPASRALDLKSLAGQKLDWRMTEISELIGTGRKQITIDQVEIERVTPYCGADVDSTLQLFHLLKPGLEEAGMWSLYEEIELPLTPVLVEMEMAGILVDTDFLQQMSNDLGRRLAEVERDLFKIVGREFNLRSTQQLSDVLFGDMGFPTRGMKKTQSGFYSTAAAELEKLGAEAANLSADQRAVLDLIFEQRQLEKLRGTYVDALPVMVHPETGRIHTSFNQTGASTGRLSSSDPNLQNIPIRTEIGREIRKGFVAPHEWVLVAADYSQVELRILAHITEEPGLLDAFKAGLDIHAATAARLFNVQMESVDRVQRDLAKMINFATIYGVSAYGLSSRTEMNPTEAQRFLDQYFATYPRVQKYIKDTLLFVQENGYVETLLGRKRFFPELLSGTRLPFMQRQGQERAAINAPIQGTAADIIKIAMNRLHPRLKAEGYRARMLLQVHDELLLECPMSEVEPVVEIICDEMENAYSLRVPLKVDVEVGPNWYDMEKV